MKPVPSIAFATGSDARAIAELSRDHIEHGLGWSWTESRVADSMRDPATNVVVMRERRALLGFGVMHYGDRSAHLALLGVQPQVRRRGLGSALFAWLEKSAVTAGVGIIKVEARVDNPAAIAFYGKLGFRAVANHAGYYRGLIDAVCLEKFL